jgi:hypothetical protein
MANGFADSDERLPLSVVLEEERSIVEAGRLPLQESVWRLQEDHLNPSRHLTSDRAESLRQLLHSAFLRWLPSLLRPLGRWLLRLGKRTPNQASWVSSPPLSLAELQALLQLGVCLYDWELFAGVPLREETRKLRKRRLTGDDLVYLNRLLLEDAFPQAIRQIETTEEERLATVIRRIHGQGQKRTALCFSGGGIRSATFNLGVLQGLARRELLERFHYLSTVSGGGYIGSWLSAWIHHHPRGVAGVSEELAPQPPVKEFESVPVRRLREYSNYLTPRWGLLSADTWTWVAIYVRNLLLNWLVLVPLFAAVLMIPRVAVAVVHLPDVPWQWQRRIFLLGTLAAVWAIGYVALHLPSSRKVSKSQEHFLAFCFLPLLLAAVSLTTWWAWFCNTHAQKEHPQLLSFILYGVIIHLLASYGAAGLRWLKSFLVTKSVSEKDKNVAQTPFSSYLSWPTVRRVLLGVGVFFFICVSGAIGGWVVWWATTFPTFAEPSASALVYVCLASPLLLALFLVATSVYVAFANYWTSDADREWWARVGGWVLIAVVGWSAASWLVLLAPQTFLDLRAEAKAAIGSLGGIAGLFTLLMGHSQSTSARTESGESPALLTILKNNAFSLAAPLFAVLLVVFLSLTISKLLIADGVSWFFPPSIVHGYLADVNITPLPHVSIVDGSRPLPLLVFAVVLMVFSLIVGYFVNINKFSLHSAYRDRLIRAYLGASRDGTERRPDLFTGFDPRDNIQMYKLQVGEKSKRFERPLHVINIALNIVGGENLGWQERKAESFTVSPLHAGNYLLGYRRSAAYGGRKKDGRAAEDQGISLGTAVTISGAAASPNSGYHSSPVVTFLMALFNVRLGWWLGNPGAVGSKVFGRRGPIFAARSLFEETFGLTTDTNRYVYLSDGGHFENLALYEMVLRRCHYIVLVDAGCDPTCALDDLGGAIRKIRTDLGIPITFAKGEFPIYPRVDAEGKKEKRPGKRFTIGTIEYSAVDHGAPNGVLLYLKPAFYGDEPIDIMNYAKASATFPHETTADQWFSESQFESYRMLGAYSIAEAISEVCQATQKGDLFEALEAVLLQSEQRTGGAKVLVGAPADAGAADGARDLEI